MLHNLIQSRVKLTKAFLTIVVCGIRPHYHLLIKVKSSIINVYNIFLEFCTSKGKNGTFIGSLCWNIWIYGSLEHSGNQASKSTQITRYKRLCIVFAAFFKKFSKKCKNKRKNPINKNLQKFHRKKSLQTYNCSSFHTKWPYTSTNLSFVNL